jgi:hypothetical protein
MANYRGRPWWMGRTEPVRVREPAREPLTLQSRAVADDCGASPAPRQLPASNESVRTILALELLLNGGRSPSLSREKW